MIICFDRITKNVSKLELRICCCIQCINRERREKPKRVIFSLSLFFFFFFFCISFICLPHSPMYNHQYFIRQTRLKPFLYHMSIKPKLNWYTCNLNPGTATKKSRDREPPRLLRADSMNTRPFYPL
jgi:hypothetical protein